MAAGAEFCVWAHGVSFRWRCNCGGYLNEGATGQVEARSGAVSFKKRGEVLDFLRVRSNASGATRSGGVFGGVGPFF